MCLFDISGGDPLVLCFCLLLLLSIVFHYVTYVGVYVGMGV